MQATVQTSKYLISQSRLLLCSFCRVWQEVECQLMLFLNIKLWVVEKEGCVPTVRLDHQELRPALVYLMDGQTTELTWKPGIRHVA